MTDRQFFDTYWAASDPVSLVSELHEKVRDYDRFLDQSGRWLTWRDLYYNYFLVNEQNYLFPNYGADGFKRININHFRAIIKHQLSLVTSNRAVPQPVATNSDAQSQSQCDFSANILKYYEKDKALERIFEKSTEIALLLGAAFVSTEWDASLGDPYGKDPATQIVQKTGDLAVDYYTPLDCIFDFASGSYDSINWCILRKYVNRWDLVAKFPAFADEIKGMSISPEVKRHRLGHIINEKNDDLVPLYTFYHKKTAAMPNGRTTIFLDSNTSLFDGDLPYKRVPIKRISADDQINSPFPYTVAMDLLPIQKVYNALCSAICTNQAAFGVQNILVPREAAISLSQLTEGLNAIYYDPSVTGGAKPEPLNLLASAPELFKWIEYLEKMMAKISGINDTIQGDPAANLKSGTALAFVASQALVFINTLSRSYNSLLEDTWTGILDILKAFATTPRMITISGISNRAEAKSFTNVDLENIDRVVVEAGNPLTQTLAGRIQVAQDLIQAGLVSKEEYITVLTTGAIEPLYAFEREELLCIKRENEALESGKPVKAMTTDNHPLHIREHLTLLSSPEARMAANNPVMVNTINHIYNEHLPMWRNMDPAIAALQSIPPAPPLPGQGPGMLNAPPGSPTAPPQGPAENPNGSKVPGAPNLPQVLNPQQAMAAKAGAIQGPKGPKLPPGSPDVVKAGYAQLQNAVPRPPM